MAITTGLSENVFEAGDPVIIRVEFSLGTDLLPVDPQSPGTVFILVTDPLDHPTKSWTLTTSSPEHLGQGIWEVEYATVGLTLGPYLVRAKVTDGASQPEQVDGFILVAKDDGLV